MKILLGISLSSAPPPFCGQFRIDQHLTVEERFRCPPHERTDLYIWIFQLAAVYHITITSTFASGQ